jgi:hypothetical protein
MLFDDYSWALQDFTSLQHPRPGIDMFMKIVADEIDVLFADNQALIRKKVDAQVDYPIDDRTIIPIMMVAGRRTIGKVFSLILSMIASSTSPSRLHFVLVDCGANREAIPLALGLSLTWVPGVGVCRPEMLCSDMALLNVFDLFPTKYAHFLFVSTSSPLVAGEIEAIWTFAPATADFSAPLTNGTVSSMNVVVVNRANFAIKAKIARLKFDVGAFEHTSPWSLQHFRILDIPEQYLHSLFA